MGKPPGATAKVGEVFSIWVDTDVVSEDWYKITLTSEEGNIETREPEYIWSPDDPLEDSRRVWIDGIEMPAGDVALVLDVETTEDPGTDPDPEDDPPAPSPYLDCCCEVWKTQATPTISCMYTAIIGMPVQIAAKFDPALDTANLMFYSYNSATNTYTQLAAPAYWIDANGYVHFTTTLGGSIIISDGPLAKKQRDCYSKPLHQPPNKTQPDGRVHLAADLRFVGSRLILQPSVAELIAPNIQDRSSA